MLECVRDVFQVYVLAGVTLKLIVRDHVQGPGLGIGLGVR